MTAKYRVEIREKKSGIVHKAFLAHSLREAEKLERGIQINLNREAFETVIEEGQAALLPYVTEEED